jgi:RNA polymerase sigma-70 factor (sigma-E family)
MSADARAFEQFVAANAGRLLRTACLVTWDDNEAEDLVQECFLRVAKHWPRVEKMELPLAYARRILVNLALDGGDRRSKRRIELSLAESVQVGDVVDASAERELLLLVDRFELVDALGKLSAQQRAVLVLRYFEDLTEQQVADVLGCSTGTVKTSAWRGLARLRDLIAEHASSTEVGES